MTIRAMCAIGRNLDTSIGANSPATTMLGSASIGGASTGPKRRGTINGTLLTPAGGGAPGMGGGGGPGDNGGRPAYNHN